MAEHQPQSKSLRDYAEFELERRGYDRAQVDAFLAELDQAFLELEKSVKERGAEVAELQREVERLKRESPAGKSEEILRRAEENAEQMLTSTIAESQQIIGNAETMAMRIIANARAQSQEIAQQPAGFGMLARVRTIAADIDRMKAEHAALMEDEPGLLGPDVAEVEVTEEKSAAPGPEAKEPKKKELEKKELEKKELEKKERPAAQDAEDLQDTEDAEPSGREPAKAAPGVEEADAEAPTHDEPVAPRVQLVESPPPEPAVEAATEAEVEAEVEADDESDDVVLDAKNFDWGAARQEAMHALGDEELPLVEELTAIDEPDDDELPTIMRREGSRYERHSASLPKRQDDGTESTLANVSKVSRRRRRRAAMRDDDA